MTDPKINASHPAQVSDVAGDEIDPWILPPLVYTAKPAGHEGCDCPNTRNCEQLLLLKKFSPLVLHSSTCCGPRCDVSMEVG